MIRQGSSIDDLLDILSVESSAFANGVNQEFSGSASSTASFLNNHTRVSLTFDVSNSRAVEYMRQNNLRLITGFNADQREVTRRALVQGLEEGLSPKATARLFRRSIGLTPHQQQSVENFRRLLETRDSAALDRALRDKRFDSTLRRAIENDEALDPKHLDKMVNRYRERYIKYRSEVISLTETQRAIHAGSEEMYRQAIQAGAIDPDSLRRRWHTRSTKPRDSHSAMNGQVRPLGEPFISGQGYLLEYPGDISAPASETIQCHCGLSTRFATVP